MVTTDSLNDIYQLALCYYQVQQYERALDTLNKKQTINKSVKARYLAALCSLALGNARDVLDYLGKKNPFSGKGTVKGRRKDISKGRAEEDESEGCIKLESVMCYVRGKAYMLLKDIDNARECFKEALLIDLKCYDALEALVKYNMMGEHAEWEFVMTLPFDDHCGPDAEYFRYLYGLKLKKNILSDRYMDPESGNLSNSLDVQLSIAERYFSEGRYEDCLSVCKKIRTQDPYFKESTPMLLACLFELDMKIELYEYAHELADKSQHEDIAYHAIGLYYLYIKKNQEARRFFTKAINLNQFAEHSWLGYAQSFSAEKDHEQAISAYMTCIRHIPGSYIPLMHIAMEYMEQNNMEAAIEYFTKCLAKNNTDPFLYNEVAVYYYKKGLFIQARDYSHTALKLAKSQQCRKRILWEKIWCNLGHVYRHEPLRNYDRALTCFENALNRNPKNTDARATVGMIYQLKGCTAKAIQEYHQALRDATDNTELIQELLDISLRTNATTPFEDINPFLGGGFDVFQMAESLKNSRDEVDIELDETYWGNERKEEETHESVEIELDETDLGNERKEYMRHDELMDDTIIGDEGDRPSMGRDWL
ncbi:unnamed protein product [Rhizopus microsporus]